MAKIIDSSTFHHTDQRTYLFTTIYYFLFFEISKLISSYALSEEKWIYEQI